MGGDTHNELSGGWFSAVVQARDIGSITVRLPAQITPALMGLPAGAPSFTGRGGDLEALLAALAPKSRDGATVSEAVVVTAVGGMGGIGKTELAVQAARTAFARGWFPGGVLFVDLFGYDDRRLTAAHALDDCLRALGVPAEHIPPEERNRARLYASVLAAYAREGRRILVVVDNASAEDQVRPLLPADGETGVLVTSRHTLGLLGARLVELAALAPEDSVDLLDRALRTARPDDTRITGDADGARRIARLCAGLPLALQIVAALLAEDPARPLSDMAEVLGDAATRLREMAHPGAAVQAAFDLSYRRLDAEQARLFRLLAVSPGPDLSTAAAAVMAQVGPDAARRTLEALARAHLVERGGAYGRWRMHDLVRLYAGERDEAEPGEQVMALVWLLFHYQSTALNAMPYLSPTARPPADGPFRDRAQALEWLDTEYAGLTATAYVTSALRIGGEALPMDMVTEMVLGLWRYFDLRRHFDDWIRLTAAVLHETRRRGRRDREASALSNLGNALCQTRRYDEAIGACRDAAAIYRELGDRLGEGIAGNNLAAALSGAGRCDEVVVACEANIKIFRELGDRYREGIALNTLGGALAGTERFAEAVTAYEKASAAFRETGARSGEGGALAGLANALRMAGGATEQAIDAGRTAVRIIDDSGDVHGAAAALNNLGAALLRDDRFESAIPDLRRAAALFRETGDRHGEGNALSNLGLALHGAKRPADAAAAYEGAGAAYRESGDHGRAAGALRDCALILSEAGRSDEAIATFRRAAAASRDTGDRRGEARALNGLGTVLRGAGRFEEALATYRSAERLFGEAGDRSGKGEALGHLATVLGVSRADQAVAALNEAIALFRDTGERRREKLARGLIGAMRISKRVWDRQADLLEAGRFEEVVAEHEDVAGTLRRFGDLRGAAVAQTRLGIALLETGRFDEAVAALEDAAAAFRDTGDRTGEAHALNRLGVALQETGRFDAAADAHTRASRLSRDAGDQNGEGVALTNLGTAFQELGRLDEAVAALETAVRLLHAAGDRLGEGVARAGLDAARRPRGGDAPARTAPP